MMKFLDPGHHLDREIFKGFSVYHWTHGRCLALAEVVILIELLFHISTLFEGFEIISFAILLMAIFQKGISSFTLATIIPCWYVQESAYTLTCVSMAPCGTIVDRLSTKLCMFSVNILSGM